MKEIPNEIAYADDVDFIGQDYVNILEESTIQFNSINLEKSSYYIHRIQNSTMITSATVLDYVFSHPPL